MITKPKTAASSLGLSLLICLAAMPAAIAVPKPGAQTYSCEQKAALVNYRSSLLAGYKKSEQQQYVSLRDKWTKRITYASQWVPNDADKTLRSLREYDKLHTTSVDEINRQISAYKSLEKKPLNCSRSNQAVLDKKVKNIEGFDGKKAVSGNALLNENKKKEADYANKRFKPDSQDMIKKLHKAKLKNPQPPHKPIKVDLGSQT